MQFLSTPSARRATLKADGLSAIERNFYPRPPRGGRLGISAHATTLAIFLSTPSARRATSSAADAAAVPVISIHALREEGDTNGLHPTFAIWEFLSTPSARRATMKRFVGCFQAQTNFYPRPPRGGRLLSLVVCALWEISIHALREEGDLLFGAARKNAVDFYPRPPRGGRPWVRGVPRAGDRFLSTPSARRATASTARRQTSRPEFLSTPSARRATVTIDGAAEIRSISIHALREEGDATGATRRFRPKIFLSTPSARRATQGAGQEPHSSGISIHALREEGDGTRI